MSSAISESGPAELQATESGSTIASAIVPRLVFAVACCTLAGLLWLGLAGKQAAIGRKIAELDVERRDLLERRVTALLAHAEATAPQHLEARAVELGFVHGSEVLYLPVDDPGALAGPSGVVEPLTISRRVVPVGGIILEPSDISSVLMSLGAAAPASAAERAEQDEAARR